MEALLITAAGATLLLQKTLLLLLFNIITSWHHFHQKGSNQHHFEGQCHHSSVKDRFSPDDFSYNKNDKHMGVLCSDSAGHDFFSRKLSCCRIQVQRGQVVATKAMP
jgi:hypothetical protein